MSEFLTQMFELAMQKYKAMGAGYEQDGRKFPRFKVDLPAVIAGDKKMIPVQLVDLSQRGVGFIVEDGTELAEQQTYLLLVSFAKLQMQPMIQIMHSTPAADGPTQYGAVFKNIREDDMQRLLLLVLLSRIQDEV
jgi:hypothetical protein